MDKKIKAKLYVMRGCPACKDAKQEIKKREEGMVHGLVEHYLETHVRELGFSSADLDDYYRDSKFGRARPRYALVPFVQEQLKTTPPHVLVERYFRNNAEIFGPLRI